LFPRNDSKDGARGCVWKAKVVSEKLIGASKGLKLVRENSLAPWPVTRRFDGVFEGKKEVATGEEAPERVPFVSPPLDPSKEENTPAKESDKEKTSLLKTKFADSKVSGKEIASVT
jgi:hypothetical protein